MSKFDSVDDDDDRSTESSVGESTKNESYTSFISASSARPASRIADRTSSEPGGGIGDMEETPDGVRFVGVGVARVVR